MRAGWIGTGYDQSAHDLKIVKRGRRVSIMFPSSVARSTAASGSTGYVSHRQAANMRLKRRTSDPTIQHFSDSTLQTTRWCSSYRPPARCPLLPALRGSATLSVVLRLADFCVHDDRVSPRLQIAATPIRSYRTSKKWGTDKNDGSAGSQSIDMRRHPGRDLKYLASTAFSSNTLWHSARALRRFIALPSSRAVVAIVMSLDVPLASDQRDCKAFASAIRSSPKTG